MLLPLEYHFPNKAVHNLALDRFLASGYFRTGNYLLRTRVLYYDNQILNTLHIRIPLAKHEFSKSMRKLLTKNNRIFTHTIKSLYITEEKEILFQMHRKRFNSNTSPSLSAYLFDHYSKNLFDTYEINIYRNQQLVGYSIFDKGSVSMASILGIFHPDFGTYSIGIYTMLLEIEYAQQQNYKYYYPGYVAYEPSKFNYKLRLSDVYDYYDWFSKRWNSFSNKDKRIKVNDYFDQHLDIAKSWLKQLDIPYDECFYPYFYMGGMYPQSDCVKGVRHLLIKENTQPGVYFIIEFHPEKLQLALTAITLHRYQFEDSIDYDEALEEKQWKRVLLYLHPIIEISSAIELLAAFFFLRELISANTQPPPLTNTSFKNPNRNR